MTSIKSEVEKSVKDLTNNNKLFTSYDVTRILRNRLTGEKVLHRDVQREVNSLFSNDQMGLYDRTLTDVTPTVSPFVYHLSNSDPQTDYDKDWVTQMLKLQTAIPSQTCPTTGKPAGTPVSGITVAQGINANGNTQGQTANSQQIANRVAIVKDGFKSLKLTKEGRLNIPKKMLSGFGSKAYVSLAKVQQGGKTVNALALTSDSANSIAQYAVQGSEIRIRISRNILDKIGSGTNFAVKDSTKNLGAQTVLIVSE